LGLALVSELTYPFVTARGVTDAHVKRDLITLIVLLALAGLLMSAAFVLRMVYWAKISRTSRQVGETTSAVRTAPWAWNGPHARSAALFCANCGFLSPEGARCPRCGAEQPIRGSQTPAQA
jgi:uncharacterized paraquat-inducible protein A